MASHMEKPACGARAVPNADLAGASINSEFINDRPLNQAAAKRLARVVFGKPPRGTIAAIGNNGLPYWRPT